VLALAGWLRCWQVPAVVMGATGDYWKGPSCRLVEEALEGAEFFAEEHAALLAAMLARAGRASAEIARLTEVIERLLAPYEEQLQQAGPVPGWAAGPPRTPSPGPARTWPGSAPARTWPPGPGAPRWTTRVTAPRTS
jgi:hypothetical protein